MQDISATGLEVTIIAIPTFPQGLKVTQFADDADPLDSAAINVTEYGMGLNGDLVTWSAPKPLPITLNVIANTDDDKNLSILLDTNTVAKGKLSVKDVLQMILRYPDGTRKVLTNGRITSGQIIPGAASSGRLKSRQYQFIFENKIN